MESSWLVVRLLCAANVLVAGVVGGLTLFAPVFTMRLLFSGTAEASARLGIVDSFWLVIAVLSGIGLVYPRPMLGVLVIQLGYKALWLLVVILSALFSGRGQSVPGGVAVFFLVWVIILPFVIPWRVWWQD